MVYFRFLSCLALGLAGLCMVLTTLMDALFADWDIYSDLKSIVDRPHWWRQSLRLEDQEDRVSALVTRLQKYETRST